ncbi:hypothetical protein, partial [Kocuria nitroreducens]|uniref:hypothetical protein n=1 Tax=Kocuria nitroreducens TaxID=3058914 RepID=UPI0036DC9DB2
SLVTGAFVCHGPPAAPLNIGGSRLSETVTFADAPEHGEELPPVTSVQILENSAEYVFDLCDLLDQAAETTTDEAASGTSAP